MSTDSGPFLWSYKLTTTFGEPPPPGWRESVEADVAIYHKEGKIRPLGQHAYFEPLLAGGELGGSRFFTTRDYAEEWAAADRARALIIPRIIVSQVIEEI